MSSLKSYINDLKESKLITVDKNEQHEQLIYLRVQAFGDRQATVLV